MTNTKDRTDVTIKWVRRIARIWSIIVIGITLVVAVSHIVTPDPYATDYPPIENLLPMLMVISVLGLAIAWRWEGVGGAINIGFFLANLGLYWIIRGKFFPLEALSVLSLAVVPGALFLICWWRSRSS